MRFIAHTYLGSVLLLLLGISSLEAKQVSRLVAEQLSNENLQDEFDFSKLSAKELGELTGAKRQEYKKKKQEAYRQMADARMQDVKVPTVARSLKDSHSRKSVKCRGCKAIPIFAKDIKNDGLVIDKPGVYCLADEISFNPSQPGLAAIIIDSSDVVLELNGHFIQQIGMQANTIGILIVSNANVQVKNGTIRNFSGTGIVANNTSDVLLFDQVNVVSCGSATGGLSSGGLLIAGSDNIEILNSTFLKNFGAGISLTNCSNINVDHCACNDTQGTLLPFPPFDVGTTGWGILAFFPSAPVVNMQVSNSSFNGTRAEYISFGVDIGTFVDTSNHSITLENCEAFDIQNIGSDTVPGREAVGIAVGANDATLRNCTVSFLRNNSANGFESEGFTIGATNILLEDCHVSDMEASTFEGPHGFNVEKIAIPDNNIKFIRCSASNITSLVNGPAAGFWVSEVFPPQIPVMNAVLDSCIVENVNTPSAEGAGFLFSSQVNLLMQNCVSNANDIGILVDDFGGPASSAGTIGNNIISNNFAFGIKDNTVAKNFIYYSNMLRSNGVNFSGAPSSTPIRNWPLPGLPNQADNNSIVDPLDNISVTP